MVELDANFRAQRRNLVTISAILTVYYVGGGHLSGISNPALGVVKLEHPSILIWTAWLVWGYALWRFFQFSGDAVKNWWECYETHLEKELGREQAIVDRYFERALEQHREHADALRRHHSAWMLKKRGKYVLTWWPGNTKPKVRRAGELGLATIEIEQNVGRRIYCKVMNRALLLDSNVSDLLLPYGIAALAPLAGAYRLVLWLFRTLG